MKRRIPFISDYKPYLRSRSNIPQPECNCESPESSSKVIEGYVPRMSKPKSAKHDLNSCLREANQHASKNCVDVGTEPSYQRNAMRYREGTIYWCQMARKEGHKAFLKTYDFERENLDSAIRDGRKTALSYCIDDGCDFLMDSMFDELKRCIKG